MLFYKRNDPNQISKLIDFETREYENPSEYDISYTSISDLEGHCNNVYRYSNSNLSTSKVKDLRYINMLI